MEDCLIMFAELNTDTLEIQNARQLALELMSLHGLVDKGWIFRFDQAKRRFGCCYYHRKIISLSSPLTVLRKPENVQNTILHEIAHALVGYGHGHDETWKAKAIEIGCNGEECSNDVHLKGDWVGVCPKGHVVHRFRKPKVRISCGICNPGIFDEEFLVEFEYQLQKRKA